MRLLDVLLPLAAFTSMVSADAVNDLETMGRTQIDTYIGAKSATCKKENLRIRREFGDLTKAERKAYIDGVLCLLQQPSKLDPKQFPGAKSRYDDFVVVHMNQSLTIHGTGNFLAWHRYYVWSWENAMRNECGYNGTQPYWDYGRWAQDPLSSPLFDGSDTSLGGNGVLANTTGGSGSFGMSPAPHGTGGGCISTGPFKNMTVYLGPLSPVADPAPKANPQTNGYGANPRCVRRDITNYLTTRYGKTTDIASTITGYTNVKAFQDFLQGATGVHGVGHFTVSGDPGGDFYISPNEPSFWVHHGMIDRIWTIWQSQDYTNRVTQMEGGTSMFGGGKAQTLDDIVDLGVVATKPYKLRDLLSSVDGPFCYVYQ